MNNKKQTIDELMNAFLNYMKSIHRCDGSLRRYKRISEKVKAFMLKKKIKFYNAGLERDFLKNELGDYDYYQLGKIDRDLVNITESFTEFQNTGKMFMGARKHHPKEFRGSAADYIKAFIDYKKHTFNLSENTIKSHIFHLYHFCTYLNNNKININKIRVPELLDYVQFMDPTKPANKHVGLNILRVFLKYLFDQLILTVDYSRIIPKDNYEDQPKLPSTFTDEEICSLLNAVDRGNPRGKRDYAILLLAIKLGLRASDICELTFENIVWERNAIVLTQKKTKKDLELPLLPEVGNAMIDYLKYGRPDTTDNHLFIHVLAPYERIHTSDLGNLVRKYFTLAKINYSNRKHGPHSLRHSFASALLREKIPLPIISETLGHSSMGVTMEYLRIDISTLKKCALEIPPIPISFYEQKGGYRHE